MFRWRKNDIPIDNLLGKIHRLCISHFLGSTHSLCGFRHSKARLFWSYRHWRFEYNPVEGSEFRHSPDKQRDAFVQFLENRNMVVHIRKSKGKDIDAACGQLANKRKD